MNKIVTKDKQKHTMKSVLDEEESNEEQRPLCLRVNEKYEQFVEKSKFQGIDGQLVSHQAKIENRLAKIDEIWQQLLDYCKQNILDREHGDYNKAPMPSWTQEEMDEVSISIDIIRKIGKEAWEREQQLKPLDDFFKLFTYIAACHLKVLIEVEDLSEEKRIWHENQINAARDILSILNSLENRRWQGAAEDNFLESSVRETMQYIKDLKFVQGNINTIDIEKIRKLFNVRLDTVDEEKIKKNGRARTKETLIEKILNGSLDAITGNKFTDEFLQVWDFYKHISGDTDNLKGLVKFYDVEQELNIGIYAIVAYELAVYGKIPKKQQKALVEKVVDLALMDNCLSRQRQEYSVEKVTEEIETWDKEERTFKIKQETYEDRGTGITQLVTKICQEHLDGRQELWEKYKKEMRELLKLKYTVLNSMPQDYHYTDKVYDYLGANTKESAKQHLNQLGEIENKQVFVYLKMLLEENNRVVQERTDCILKTK